MAKFTSILIAVVAAVSGANAFKQACQFPYDVCGWKLQDGVLGYTPEEIQAAAPASVTGNALYGSIFHCLENGAIEWAHTCARDACDPPSSGALPNYNCAP
ncbi:hypothetical protein QBC37DRAFT_399833 [Rhypophila decipiens]|uniref:Uncharacterized protein n=1 Tax=Rhypophila decipiens TaxID=261697 RepID=A0AAN6Y7Q7_9PEZI|nr:hypothetical protein QBC37DRAFT_399833 [Rhypophila decipiens]